jgi:hypothetical protein
VVTVRERYGYLFGVSDSLRMTYLSQITFSFAKVDPSSLTVEDYRDGAVAMRMRFTETVNESTADEEKGTTEEKPRNEYSIYASSRVLGERVTKAFIRATELCGGKKDVF